MFPVKQAKRSALADVSCKTSEALFAKQKCFFKFTKKQILKILLPKISGDSSLALRMTASHLRFAF